LVFSVVIKNSDEPHLYKNMNEQQHFYMSIYNNVR